MFQQFIEQFNKDAQMIQVLASEHVQNNTNFVQQAAQNPVEASTAWFTKAVKLNTDFASQVYHTVKDRIEQNTQHVQKSVDENVKKTSRKS